MEGHHAVLAWCQRSRLTRESVAGSGHGPLSPVSSTRSPTALARCQGIRHTNPPIVFQSTDGWRVEVVRRTPTAAGCHQVDAHVYQNNRLVPELGCRRPSPGPRGPRVRAVLLILVAWGVLGCAGARSSLPPVRPPNGVGSGRGTRIRGIGPVRDRARLVVRRAASGAHHGLGRDLRQGTLHGGASHVAARHASPGDQSRERPDRSGAGERSRPVRCRPGARPEPGGRRGPRHGGRGRRVGTTRRYKPTGCVVTP